MQAVWAIFTDSAKYAFEGLFKVGDDIIDMFQSDRYAPHGRFDSGTDLFLVTELLMNANPGTGSNRYR